MALRDLPVLMPRHRTGTLTRGSAVHHHRSLSLELLVPRGLSALEVTLIC